MLANDALDRFGTSLEQRFNKKEIITMLENANFDLTSLIANKKKRKNSRTKGNSFERKVSHILNTHFNTTEFMRSPGSGAFSTTHKLPDHLKFSGDLITPKNFRFIIECKKGYNKENLIHKDLELDRRVIQTQASTNKNNKKNINKNSENYDNNELQNFLLNEAFNNDDSIEEPLNLDKVKYRFSLSKTLARPEFREVANFAYYDFVRNAQILGNSKLEKSDIYNVDLKWELYPKAGENISVSVFGKQFIRPIEQIVADGSVPSNLLLTYTNPNNALLYGVELEFRKKVMSWLDVYTNASVMNSEVEVNGIKRQLQGQSNYVLNSGVNIHKKKNTINITYNRVGDRISAVGFQGYPNIFENSRDVLDITLLHKLPKGEIKLAIGDVFGQSSIYYQKLQNRNLIKTNNEQTISLTLNLNL